MLLQKRVTISHHHNNYYLALFRDGAQNRLRFPRPAGNATLLDEDETLEILELDDDLLDEEILDEETLDRDEL